MLRACALVLILLATVSPARAQDTSEPGTLMERGMELFFEGLRQEMSPALENLRDLAEEFGPSMRSFLEEMGPAFASVLDEVRDWSAYEPPEILPNGDIILRKKVIPQTPPPPPQEPPASTTTDI